MNLIIWFTLWFVVWIGYNLMVKKWRISKDRLTNHKLIYFALPTLTASLLFQTQLTQNLDYLILGFLVTSVISQLVYAEKILTGRIGNGKNFIYSLPTNILFQQTMFVSAIYLSRDFSINISSDLAVGLIGVLAHLPILMLKWAKLRYLYLFLIFVGCSYFSYIVKNYPYGILMAFLTHYLAYIGFMMHLKNDEHL